MDEHRYENDLEQLVAYADVSDVELLKRAKYGDVEAVGALYVRHAVRCYRFARTKGLAHQDAEDFVDTVFENVITGVRTFNEEHERAGGWLIMVRQHTLYSFWRRTGPTREREEAIPEEAELVSVEPSPEDIAADRELHEAYDCARRQVTEQDRQEIDRGPGRGVGRNTWKASFSRLCAAFRTCFGPYPLEASTDSGGS